MSIINSDGLNTNWQLNVLRGLQAIADEVAKPLTCAEDGITICSPITGLNVNVHDGTGIPITSTINGTDKGLDVNIINALPLEINLDAANDQVGIYGYDGTTPTPISVDSNGFVNTNATVTFPSSLSVTQNALSNPWTVAGTVALDATTLTALENITVQNGAGAAAVNIQDGGNSITVDGTIAATQSGTWNINNISGVISLPTGAATETTLAAVNTKLTPTTRTHNTVSATGAGSVPAGSLRGSVINVGSAAGTWNGVSIPAGVAIPWDAVGPRDTYGAIAYNATGTTFIIEYTN